MKTATNAAEQSGRLRVGVAVAMAAITIALMIRAVVSTKSKSRTVVIFAQARAAFWCAPLAIPTRILTEAVLNPFFDCLVDKAGVSLKR